MNNFSLFHEVLFFLFILRNKYQQKSLKRSNKISTIGLQHSFKQKEKHTYYFLIQCLDYVLVKQTSVQQIGLRWMEMLCCFKKLYLEGTFKDTEVRFVLAADI